MGKRAEITPPPLDFNIFIFIHFPGLVLLSCDDKRILKTNLGFSCSLATVLHIYFICTLFPQ